LEEVLKGTSVEDLIKPLEDLLRSIVEELRPTRILITGSLARKEFVRGLSDIDILVLVVVDYEVPSGKRFMLASVGGVDVEVTVVSRYELEKALDEGREFYVDAVRYGVEVFP
jgi:predicted nucleotidyltransferase